MPPTSSREPSPTRSTRSSPEGSAARAALDTAHQKTEQWDAEDREWNERGTSHDDDA